MQKVLLCLSLQWWHSVAIELNGVVIDGYGVYFLTVVVAVLRWYEELFKVVETAIVDVEVDISFYSQKQSGRIGVLPELPLPAILHLVDVVVGNPIGVAVKSLVGQIGILEFRIGIDYRLTWYLFSTMWSHVSTSSWKSSMLLSCGFLSMSSTGGRSPGCRLAWEMKK